MNTCVGRCAAAQSHLFVRALEFCERSRGIRMYRSRLRAACTAHLHVQQSTSDTRQQPSSYIQQCCGGAHVQGALLLTSMQYMCRCTHVQARTSVMSTAGIHAGQSYGLDMRNALSPSTAPCLRSSRPAASSPAPPGSAFAQRDGGGHALHAYATSCAVEKVPCSMRSILPWMLIGSRLSW